MRSSEGESAHRRLMKDGDDDPPIAYCHLTASHLADANELYSLVMPHASCLIAIKWERSQQPEFDGDFNRADAND